MNDPECRLRLLRTALRLFSVPVSCLLLASGFQGAFLVAQTERPNVVVILADDMGWNQVGYHGSSFYETPNIDRIAREGIRLTHAYAAAPICSPTRAALMTGKAPARLHLTDFIPGRSWDNKPLVTPQMRQGLPLAERTLPEYLKQGGYISGLFGKWHLAEDYDYRPHRPMDPETQGFEIVHHTRKPSSDNLDTPDAHNAVEISDRAIRFIEQNRSRPFFCYVSHNVVHRPLTEELEMVAKYRAKPGANLPENVPVMAAMIERMDTGVGRILDALERFGLAERTLVVFMSDNGNVMADQSQAPLRAGKATLWEGGLRVPLAIRWPGVVEAGRESQTPIVTHDLFPTILDAAGVSYPRETLDGASLIGLLQGTTTLARDALYWHYPHYHHLGDFRPGAAIRAGRYKLIEWFEGALLGRGPVASLFDVVADPGESRDLVDEHPELARELLTRLREWRRSVGAQEMTVRGAP